MKDIPLTRQGLTSRFCKSSDQANLCSKARDESLLARRQAWVSADPACSEKVVFSLSELIQSWKPMSLELSQDEAGRKEVERCSQLSAESEAFNSPRRSVKVRVCLTA